MPQIFIAILLLFTGSIHVERAVRHRERPPEFDSTGMQYRENYESIIVRPCQPPTEEWRIADLYLDSFPFVRANNVKRITCDYGGKSDTITYYSLTHDDTITVHRHAGTQSRKSWLFDDKGRVTDYVSYSDTTEQEVNEKRHFTYDAEGFMVSHTLWYIEDGISKQYRGYTVNSIASYKWSVDHRVCSEQFSSELVSLPGASKRERKYWDHETKTQAHWEFNGNHQPVIFSGVMFGHQSEVIYSYDAKSRIVQRRINFKDCKGGCIDSFAWIESGGRQLGYHYFSVIQRGRIVAYHLLETLGFTYDNKLIYKSVEDSAFGWEQFKHLRGKVFVATYDGDELIREEERDENQNVVVARSHQYFQYKTQQVVRMDWLETDTSRADTIRTVYKYTDQRGLLTAIDIYNIDGIWWNGTWFFPEYFDVNDKEYYRFRYEFYED